MQFFSNFKILLPFLLPFAILFSRSVADITIIVIALLFLLKSYLERDWDWAKESWFKFACIFFAYCVFINAALSINPTESLKYSIFFMRWPLFALALVFWIFKDAISLKKFLYTTAFLSLFLVLDSWYQYFVGVDIFGFEKYSPTRLTGPFSGPHIGMWLTKIITLPLFLLVLLKQGTKFFNQKYAYLFFLLFCATYFLTVFITGERMALLMTLLSLFIILIGLVLNKNISLTRVMFLLLALGIFTYLFSNLYPEQSNRAITSTIVKITNWQSSDYGLVWKSAYDVWQQSPLFGVGLHKYREACELLGTYGTAAKPIGQGVCFHPHNITMQLLSETGIAGLFIFFAMVTSLAIKLLKEHYLSKRWLCFFLLLNVLVACFLPFQSNTSFFSNKYGALVWLLVGIALAINKQLTANSQK